VVNPLGRLGLTAVLTPLTPLSARGNPERCALLPMPADPLAALVAAVFDPAVARPSGRLRPVVVGRPRPLVRLPRRRRVVVVSHPFCRPSWSSVAGRPWLGGERPALLDRPSHNQRDRDAHP
jgi:hypothetical protein